MPGIRSDFELDISAALRAVDELQDAITDSLTTAIDQVASSLNDAFAALTAAPSTLELTVDTTEATDILTAFQDSRTDQEPLGIPVTLDETALIDALESAKADLDLTITADTSDAAASVDDVVADISGTTATVTVDADTTPALEETTRAVAEID